MGLTESDRWRVKMAMQQLTLPGDIVKKSNAIARASWQPKSKWEPRIVALVASKVRTDDEDFYTYRIPVTELAGISDENMGGYQYQEIAKSIERLGKATIRIQGKNPRNFIQYTIFAKCGYEDGELIAGFHPDLKSHYLQLGKHFTEFNLFEYLLLPSSYSQRVFEVLKSWANRPEVTISVAELHEMLNSPESIRKDFRQFRIRVLEKAHKDIQEKTSLRYEWEPMKAGRSVEFIRFMFAPGRKAVAKASAKKADRGKRSCLSNQRALKAYNCAMGKDGKCARQDNKPIICKTCVTMDYCQDILRKGGRLPAAPMPDAVQQVLGNQDDRS